MPLKVLGHVALQEPGTYQVLGTAAMSPASVSAQEEWEAIKQQSYQQALEQYNKTKEATAGMAPPTADELTTEFGMPISPEELAAQETAPPTYEGTTERIEKLRTSPSRYVMEEGLRGAYPFAFGGKEDALKSMPSFKDTFGREKTFGESALQFGTTIAAELPGIVLAEAAAGAVLPSALLRLGKTVVDVGKVLTKGEIAANLSLRMLASGVRLGTTGAIYEGAMAFGEELTKNDDIRFDIIGQQAVRGFITWGTLGAIGPLAGHTLLSGWKKAKQLTRLERLTARARNSGIDVTLTEPMKAYGGSRMVELVSPYLGDLESGGALALRQLFPRTKAGYKAAHDFLARLELDDVGRAFAEGTWGRYHDAWKAAYNMMRKELSMPPPQGFEFWYNKLFGGIKYLAQRVEASTFSKARVQALRDSLIAMGYTEKGAAKEVPKILASQGHFRLWSNFVRRALEGEARARHMHDKWSRVVRAWVDMPIADVAKRTGRGEREIAYEIYELLSNYLGADPIDPKSLVSVIESWRARINKAGEGGLVEALTKLDARVDRFIRAHEIPEKMSERFAARLKNLVVQQKIKLTPAVIKKTFGKSLEGIKEAQYRVFTPDGERVIPMLTKIDPEVMAIAKRARKLYNAMFRSADLDPAIFRRAYASMMADFSYKEMQKAMTAVPLHARPTAKFFAMQHREGNLFKPDKDIRSLLRKYAWGASRQAHLNKVLNEGREMVARMPNDPLRKVFMDYADDLITGAPQRQKQAIVRWMAHRCGVPAAFFSELYDTMWAISYASLMGVRPWLWARNLTQPLITTLVAVGPKRITSFVKGYKALGSRYAWEEFNREAIKMQRGAGLPLGEEIFHMLRKAEARAPDEVGWEAARKVLSIIREVSHKSLSPYVWTDHINRMQSYWTGRFMVEAGSKSPYLGKLATEIRNVITKLPTAPVKGKMAPGALLAARTTAINKILKSKNLAGLMEACGLRSAFGEAVVERDFARPLIQAIFNVKVSGVKKGLRLQYPFATGKGLRSVTHNLKMMLVGSRGKPSMRRALARASYEGVEAETVLHTFRDSLSRRAGRMLTEDTQWIYRRQYQAEWMQNRIFGQFGVWGSNWLNFVRRHLLEVGTLSDRAQKVATYGATAGGLYAILTHLNINPSYLFTSYTPHTGGPVFKSLLDMASVLNPFGSGVEKQLAWQRVQRVAKELVVPGMSEWKSLYKMSQGKKGVFTGILGAPEKKRISQYQGPIETAEDSPEVQAMMDRARQAHAVMEQSDDKELAALAKQLHDEELAKIKEYMKKR